MKKILLVVLISLFSAPHLVYSQDNFESKLLKQFHAIQSEEMMTWLEKLCSPEFNGRLTGTPEFVLQVQNGLQES